MALIDVVDISELTQSEVDSKNKSTTVYTGLNFPDQGQGFLIIGRIVQDRKREWQPLKAVIKRIIIEYDEAFSPIQAPPEENSLLAE